VALDAVLEVADALFEVLRAHLGLRVLVAAVAGVAAGLKSLFLWQVSHEA
jgi:hypothetical protein